MRLIEVQNNLNNIRIRCHAGIYETRKVIEESLVKKADIVQNLCSSWNSEEKFFHIFLVNYYTDQHMREIKRLDGLIKDYEAKGIVKKLNWDSESNESRWIQNKWFA
ncbi:hypothetical protein GLOIN_2v1549073 [Rhizophagus clarus]|uniref:Uncharacterized protein n=1 Tax=Rhizophagus clarus TaxID=94130 RepID=A0A8H3MA52_9GLOM|nr:hypothetical protein GLOIN_2v1549073 [Rhizophagus clarus]